MATGDGIQKLLAAENAASLIVAEARKVRLGLFGPLPTRCMQDASGRVFLIQCMRASTSAAWGPRRSHAPRSQTRQTAADRCTLHRMCPPRPPQAKQERLRQAKAEAEREIAAYKAEREGAYQKKLAEVRSVGCAVCLHSVCQAGATCVLAVRLYPSPHSMQTLSNTNHTPRNAPPPQTTSGAAATSERLHKETELAIKQVQADVKASKGAVVDMLLKYATSVQLGK
jgi:hypothetical protein